MPAFAPFKLGASLGSKAKNIRLQKAAKSSKDNLPWALVAGVFLAAVLAATIRWPGDLRVSGSLVAEAVSIVADDGIRIDPDLGIDKQVNIVGLTSLEPPPEIKRDSVAAKNVTLHAPQLSLASLSISPGTDVTLIPKLPHQASSLGFFLKTAQYLSSSRLQALSRLTRTLKRYQRTSPTIPCLLS